MLVSLKDIVGCEDYYIDDQTFQIVSFKQKKYTEGKILRPHILKDGYIIYYFSVNGKVKHILLHHIIVKLFINPDFDPTKSEVDHKDHNRTNNSIENLRWATQAENCCYRDENWNKISENVALMIKKYGYDGFNNIMQSILKVAE